jgi:SynChlorMet cassette radical SAM/SPASM protein ScmF
LPFELYCSIIKEAKPLGLSTVKLTGGEPLLHPQIIDIIDFTRREGLSLSIETNGVLCTKEIASNIAFAKNPFVCVSLDGVNAETHEWVRGVKGCFDDALTGIKNLINAGVKTQIIMAIMKHNSDQMEPMVRLAESLGVGSVKFNIVQPTSRGEQLFKSGDTLSIEELINIGDWVENNLSSSKVKISYGHPLSFRPLGNMFGHHGSGCGICRIKNIIGVLSDGSYALCCIGKTIPELIFGNARNDKLDRIWANSPILKELRDYLPSHLEGVCSECAMKNICLGSCIAQNYYLTKSLWAPHWYCEEAYKKGLFPVKRLFNDDTGRERINSSSR